MIEGDCRRLVAVGILLCLYCHTIGSARAEDLPFVPGDGAQERQANRIVNDVLNDRRFLLDGIIELEALHARVDNTDSQVFIGQMLGTFETFAGDYEAAVRYCGASSGMHSGGAPTDGVNQPAGKVLSELAMQQRALLLNESHCDPAGRGLVLELLPELAKVGYRSLALETLTLADDIKSRKGKSRLQLKDQDLRQRGYPLDVMRTGVYTREPLMGDIVRTALKSRMHVFGYDDADADGVERERAQASNIIEILGSSDRKLIVLGGLGHMSRSPAKKLMAWWLGELGFKAFATVDQTNSGMPATGAGMPSEESGNYVAIVKDGLPWSADLAAFDVTILTRVRSLVGGRPSWLDLDGIRRRIPIDGGFCQGRLPCIVEAWYSGESSRAVPADRYILRSREQSSFLYLRAGDYLLASFDRYGKKQAHYGLRVK